jgi:hypothetical protein
MYASVLKDPAGPQTLDAPGLINLMGVRYITLRCPEIEDHICSTGKYGAYSTGIGVFKLLNSNQVVQLRFDFVNLVRKPFHPIGRLSRLTLRFELSDGTLYDFKGIDNQLLLTIKYYSPSPRRPGDPAAPGGPADGVVVSTLNPDYDPDFVRYVARRDAFAAHLDDPGAERDDDEDYEEEDEDGGEGEDGEDAYGEEDDRYRASDDAAKLRRRVALAEGALRNY